MCDIVLCGACLKDVRGKAVRSGLYTISPDAHPGDSSGIDGFYHAVRFSGTDLCYPIVGQVIAEMITGEDLSTT